MICLWGNIITFVKVCDRNIKLQPLLGMLWYHYLYLDRFADVLLPKGFMNIQSYCNVTDVALIQPPWEVGILNLSASQAIHFKEEVLSSLTHPYQQEFLRTHEND
jgi:hypothetical protein